MPPSIAGSRVSAAATDGERDQHAADADAAHDGLGQHDEREQADRDGDARLSTTAWPAVAIAATTASSLSRPWCRSSRQRVTSSSE